MVDVRTVDEALLKINGQLKGEIGVCIVEGSIESGNEKIEKGNMLISKEEHLCELVIGKNSHLLLFGGTPFEEERQIFWNFVASDKALIEAAKEKWKEKKFEMLTDDNSYIRIP